MSRLNGQDARMAYRANHIPTLPSINTMFDLPLPTSVTMPAIQGVNASNIVPVLEYNSSVPPSSMPSPILSDSDSSGIVYSPVGSRRSSMSTAIPRARTQRSRKTSRATGRKQCASPVPVDGVTMPCKTCGETWCSHIEKAIKERGNRKTQGERLQDGEDYLQIYANLSTLRLQSPGNHNAAGLDITKNEVLDWLIAFGASRMQKEYERALREGRLEDWQRGVQSEMTGICAQGHPLAGTWLIEDPTAKPCDHKRHSKTCIVHGHEDWSKCRKERRQRHFDLKKRHFLSHLASSKNQETARRDSRL